MFHYFFVYPGYFIFDIISNPAQIMKDKVVVITGASSGIGLACARAFAKEGSKLVLAARSLDKLQSLARELDPAGKNCMAVKTDVSVEEDCINLIDKTIEKFARLDILVNNAGISMRALLVDVETSVLRKVMDVNFWGTVYCTKYAIPHLQKSKGTLVGVSSIAGFHGLPGRTAYSASKFAMHGFLESVRIENMKQGVHVMLLAASFTSSNIRKNALTENGQPQGETPRPEEKLTSPEKVAKNLIRSIKKKKRTRIMSFEGQYMVLFQRIVPLLTDLVIYKKFASEPNSPLK